MIGTGTRAARAAGLIDRMATRQGGNTVRLIPPIGTGGTYSSTAMRVTEVAYTPTGPIPAALKAVTDDEVQKGMRGNEQLSGDHRATGSATIARQAGLEVDAKWRIEVDGAERAVVNVETHDSYLKVFYA